ncbi:MAG: hypothetical protein ACI9FB_002147 [Candidatus Azotimanducaceae bacterium]|jgi:hypothetical protein
MNVELKPAKRMKLFLLLYLFGSVPTAFSSELLHSELIYRNAEYMELD